MSRDNDADLPGLTGQWTSRGILKRDVFSTVERGEFTDPEGRVAAVLRRIDRVPWWTFPLARYFLRKEARALRSVQHLNIAPRLLHQGRRALVRSWIDGVPLHIARPAGRADYFASAKARLRAMHRVLVSHNDLAKEQNWLVGKDGLAYLTDFQLAIRFTRRTRLFRLAAYEDLRHLLKHKRRYVPNALTAAEKRVLARKAWPTRVWMATGKRVYIWITRGLFRYTDREGSGGRLVRDAPRLAATLRSHPGVREVAIVAFPDRRAGTGLYAFVEARGPSAPELGAFLEASLKTVAPPEHLQVTDALPRAADGSVRIEILQLIAMNQVDQIDPLVGNDDERLLVERIAAERRNLRDRFAF